MSVNVLDRRAYALLRALIEQYIAEGKPVGSRTLSRRSGLDLSPATIRNIMADLEEHGYIVSPHTSAGRIPTPRGYRLFVDTLLTLQPLNVSTIQDVETAFQQDQPQKIINAASQLLAQLTHFASVVATPHPPAQRLVQMEFIPISKGRTLLILVDEHGEVQNRLLKIKEEFTPSELQQLSNFASENYRMLTLAEIRGRLGSEIQHLRKNLVRLFKASLDEEQQLDSSYVLSGEHQLLNVEDWAHRLDRLQELFALLKQKHNLMELLEMSSHAEGVKLFIGQESGLAALGECSVVAAPYTVNGNVVGALGVIGPTRMPYKSVIPIVDITARLLSNALSHP